MTRFNLICTRGGAATTTTRSSQQHIATTKEETRCSSSSSSTCISVRDNACSGAAVRPCLRFTNALGQLRTIATSSRQQEGEMSHDIVLKLQSHDFKCVYRRQHENSLNVNKHSQTTSILPVLRNLRFAGIVSCWGVEHRCRLHFPLISQVRFP